MPEINVLELLATQPALVVIVFGAYWLLEHGHKRELESAKQYAADIKQLLDITLATLNKNNEVLSRQSTTLENLTHGLRRQPRTSGGSGGND